MVGTVPPSKHRGLILLVSRLESCQTAIRYHSPVLEYCWLICSPQSLQLAQQLKQEFSNLKIPKPIVVNDVYDPQEFYQEVKKIYTKLLPPKLTEKDVIADFTGMTAQASVGMVLAARSLQGELQYTPAEVNAEGQPTGHSSSPMKIEIVLESLVSNTGNAHEQ
jgi:hypothetical protein